MSIPEDEIEYCWKKASIIEGVVGAAVAEPVPAAGELSFGQRILPVITPSNTTFELVWFCLFCVISVHAVIVISRIVSTS